MKWLVIIFLGLFSGSAISAPEIESTLFEEYQKEARRLLEAKFGKEKSSEFVYVGMEVLQKVIATRSIVTVRSLTYIDPSSEVTSIKSKADFGSDMEYSLARLRSGSSGDITMYGYKAYVVGLYKPKELSNNVQEMDVEQAFSIRP